MRLHQVCIEDTVSSCIVMRPLPLIACMALVALAYAVVRLWREPPAQDLSERSQRLARFAGFPKFFDNLLAKSLTIREKLGWLLFFVIAVLAIILTGKPK